MKLSHNLVGINGVAPSATNPLPVRLTDGASFFSNVNPLPVTGTVSVDNLPAIQVISGTVTANIGTIDGLATETTLADLNTKVTTTANGLKVDGSAATQPVAQSGTWSVQIQDNTKATYAAAVVGLSFANNPTDIFTITGSATKTVKIRHISIDGTQTTAASRAVILLKRSTANAGGNSTTLTAVPFDSNNPAATATVRAYTTNPGTLGTLVGNMQSEKLLIPVVGSTTDDALTFSQLEASLEQPITLRGANEVLAINMNGVTSAGNVMNVDIIWTEE